MAITVTERMGSRTTVKGSTRRTERLYSIAGTADDAAAATALAAEAPLTLGTGVVGDPYLPRQTYRAKPVFVDTAHPSTSLWEGTVTYGRSSRRTRLETGGDRFSFDTTGGTEHIIVSRATSGIWTAGGEKDCNSFHNMIGIPKDGATPAGVDIPVPTYKWAETHCLENAYVTSSYRKHSLFPLTGRVNAYRFRDFEEGEVLFLGAYGGQRGEEDWEITFKFAARPNQRLRTIGAIEGVNKRGWEYLWLMQKQQAEVVVVQGKERHLFPPEAVVVEQVSLYGDFRMLGIGT